MAYYKIEWDAKAKKGFNSLDNSVKLRVEKYLKKIVRAKNQRDFGKRLTRNLVKYWRYRVGDYRIIVEILDDKLIILIIDIDHRKEIYDE